MTERLSRRNLFPKVVADAGLFLFVTGACVIAVKTGISVEAASRIPRPPDEDVKRATDIMYKFDAKTDAAISRAEDSGVGWMEITIPQEVRDAKKVLNLNRPYNEKIRDQNSDAFSGLDGKAAAISTGIGLVLIAIANKIVPQTK